MGTRKNFFEIDRKIGHAASKFFARRAVVLHREKPGATHGQVIGHHDWNSSLLFQSFWKVQGMCVDQITPVSPKYFPIHQSRINLSFDVM
jgi:hypothetical protein